MNNQLTTKSAGETSNFAQKYAHKLKGGEIIGLIGELGAGKTVFCQGLAKGLGYQGNVNSPTFVIMKIYPLKKTSIKNLIHIDAYRLETEHDLQAIGATEYFGRPDSVVLIEWADKIKKILPKKTEFIKLEINNKERKIYKKSPKP